MEKLLTAEEVAALLKVSKWMVYELCKERTREGDLREHPLPALRFGTTVRFHKGDVYEWVVKETKTK